MRGLVAATSLVVLGASEEAGVQETCRGTDSRGNALLQTARHKSVLAGNAVDVPTQNVNTTAHLPLCHSTIVDETCKLLNGASADDAESTTVDSSTLASLLSASGGDMSAAWSALGLGDDPVVRCQDLCTSVLKYIGDEGGVLPPDSDTACYGVGGNVTCDVNVSPETLVSKVAGFTDESPDAGEMILEDAEPDATTADGKPLKAKPLGHTIVSREVSHALQDNESADDGKGDEEQFVPYTAWEVALRIASLFRVYPARPGAREKVTLLQEGAEALATSAAIRSYDATARAWMSVVLREMNAGKSTSLRRKWFGSGGSKSDAQVRSRVLRTMNFVERELLDGIHYIYPGENAKKSACAGNVAAYVWKGASSQDYLETTFPNCNNGASDPWNEPCAVDRSGRYVVYICQGWTNSDEAFKIAALIHEAAHHTGPSDKSYDDRQMQSMSQANQLNNAANYEKLARDIAEEAWGCKDTDGACAHYKKNGYCSTSNVANVCRFTCGLCSFSGSPGGGGSSGSSRRRASSSAPCADEDAHCGFYAESGYCSTSNIKKQCRKSCGLCSGGGSTPSSCTDTDSNCGFYSSEGYCKSSSSVKNSCKKSCGLCR